jgi:LacI family transcriptional regulator
MALNIKDIAKLAGVAISTVSRVLNDHPDVSQETREHVLAIMAAHHYIPNDSARNLKRTTSYTVGVMVKGRDNPFFSQMIAAIENVVTERGYSMLLHYHHDDKEDVDAALALIKEKRLSALICLGGDFSLEGVRDFQPLNVPVVLTSVELEGIETVDHVSSVSIQNAEAAYQAIVTLIQLGHTRIGLIATSHSDRTVGRLRIQGYRRAYEEFGLEIDDDLLVGANYSFESGYNAAQALLALEKPPSAIFAISDVMAIGVAKAALEKGLKIPEDISVMGFDGLDYSTYFHPSIATVEQPVESMGVISAHIALEGMLDLKKTRHEVLTTRLLHRASIGHASAT